MITFSFFNRYFVGKDLFCFLNSKMDRYIYLMKWWAFQVALVVKNSPANVGRKRHGFDPWVGKIPWRRVWQPPPVFLPGKSHGQRSLAGHSPWCSKSHTRLSNWTTETCVIYFTIKKIKSSCQKWWLWAKPVCGTCQIHFTPCLPTWPSPRGPPNCKLQIYRPTKPRWFPVIAARGTVMNTCPPARFRMRFGRIFTAGSKTLLQSSSLSRELGSIAMEPHHLLL